MENNQEPTNKDLHHLISDIKDKLEEIKEKDLPEINERAKVTNNAISKVNAWKERVTGAAWAIGVTTTIIIIPLFTWAFVTISNIPDTIDESVDAAFNNRIIHVAEETNE